MSPHPTLPRKEGEAMSLQGESLEVRTAGLVLLSHQGLLA